MRIVGINGYTARDPDKGITHNSGATLVEDGRIVVAIDEERLSRQKNDKRFPMLALDAVLAQGGAKPDFVALAHLSRHRIVGDMVRGYWKARKAARNPFFRAYLSSRLSDFSGEPSFLSLTAAPI